MSLNGINSDQIRAFFLDIQDQRLIVDYFYIASAALLFYEYLLNIHLEIELIWFSRWNYTKVLFILNRYIPMIDVYFLFRIQLLTGATVQGCTWTYPVAVWLLLFGLYFAEAILMLRTWAVWHGNKKIGMILLVTMTSAVIAGCVGTAFVLRTIKLAPTVYPAFQGCFVIGVSKIFFYEWIILAIIDAVPLILMFISTYRSYKRNDSSALTNIVHRDGIQFYVYLICLTIANVLTTVAAPIVFSGIFLPLQSALYSVFTSRIVLNLRAAAGNTVNGSSRTAVALHTTPLEPLEFRRGPNRRPQSQSEASVEEIELGGVAAQFSVQ